MIYCDHFNECESGKARLEKELVLSPGIKSVQFDLQAMTISVTYNSKRTNEQKIRELISKMGYDADDVKADPKGREKLDDCCRKKE
jgi:periplasmic mercuric ion binding protein